MPNEINAFTSTFKKTKFDSTWINSNFLKTLKAERMK